MNKSDTLNICIHNIWLDYIFLTVYLFFAIWHEMIKKQAARGLFYREYGLLRHNFTHMSQVRLHDM